MRLIDVDEALKLKDKEMNWVYDLTDLDQFLAGVPTADAEPVKHAKWINQEKLFMKCSNCEKEVLRLHKATYCPYCGAKMDAESGDS